MDKKKGMGIEHEGCERCGESNRLAVRGNGQRGGRGERKGGVMQSEEAVKTESDCLGKVGAITKGRKSRANRKDVSRRCRET